MKRLLILLGLIVLAGCGNDELNDFIESFNENAYEFTSVDLIDGDKLEDTRKEKYGSWRKLYNSNSYHLEAKYDDNDNLIGYNLSIPEEEPYVDLKGVGYETSLVLTKTVGLNRDDFVEHFQKAIETGERIVYNEAGYKVSMFSMKISDRHTGMTVHYEKASE